MNYIIVTTVEFTTWFEAQNDKLKGLVRSRLARIEFYGHFGQNRHLGDGVFELKWKSGLRVYYAFIERNKIVVLLGGTKNGQQKDIKKAKTLICR